MAPAWHYLQKSSTVEPSKGHFKKHIFSLYRADVLSGAEHVQTNRSQSHVFMAALFFFFAVT